MDAAAILVKWPKQSNGDLNDLMNNPSNSPVISEKKMFR